MLVRSRALCPPAAAALGPRAAAALGLHAAAALALLALGGATLLADEGPDGGVAHGDIRTAEGKVSALGWDDHRITLAASDGPLTLTFDRNTTVFLESRLGSLRDVAVGVPVRVSFGPEKRAFWLEVRPRGVVPPPGGDAADGGTPDAPDAGVGPPKILAPPVLDGGAGAPDAGAPSEPAQPPAASPGSDARPIGPTDGTRPPVPGPAGPGPVPGGPLQR
jgi:hypothetical protein